MIRGVLAYVRCKIRQFASATASEWLRICMSCHHGTRLNETRSMAVCSTRARGHVCFSLVNVSTLKAWTLSCLLSSDNRPIFIARACHTPLPRLCCSVGSLCFPSESPWSGSCLLVSHYPEESARTHDRRWYGIWLRKLDYDYDDGQQLDASSRSRRRRSAALTSGILLGSRSIAG